MASRPTGTRKAAEIRVSAVVPAPLRRPGIARLAGAVLAAERSRVAALSITLVGPARIRSLNRAHLGHDHATDVIAFAYRGTGAPAHRAVPIVGDVYICPAVARRHAAEYGTTVKDELRRLVVHGVLHVVGYDHPAADSRTASPMWRRQERYLRRFGALAR